MAQVIKPKRKFTTGAPTTSDLVEGEIAINTADKILYIRDNANNIIEVAGGGGGGGGSTTDVTQSSHGLAVKDCIRHNGSAWVKAQADSASTLALGVVTAAADANTFTVAQSGRFELSSHGLTAGQWYYLSADTAGALTATEPTISQPLVYVEDANNVFVFPYRPTQLLVNGGASVVPGDGTVTNAKMADDAIDSAEIVDGSIDLVHMSANSVDSNQYVDGSIDTAHIANDQITNALMADDAVGVAQLSATGTASSTTYLRGDNAWSTISAGGAYTAWSVKTGAYTAVSKDQLIVNSASAVTITLPASPSQGDTVIIKNIGAGLVTVGRNGSEIEDADQDGTLGSTQAMQVVFVTGLGWKEI